MTTDQQQPDSTDRSSLEYSRVHRDCGVLIVDLRAQLADMQRQRDLSEGNYATLKGSLVALQADHDDIEAERDEARDECADWEERYGDLLDDATGLRVLADRYQEHREAAEREVERLKPVVEAARKYRAAWFADASSDEVEAGRALDEAFAVLDALPKPTIRPE